MLSYQNITNKESNSLWLKLWSFCFLIDFNAENENSCDVAISIIYPNILKVSFCENLTKLLAMCMLYMPCETNHFLTKVSKFLCNNKIINLIINGEDLPNNFIYFRLLK